MKDNKPANKDLFVTDIAYDAEEADVRKLFSVCGTVKMVNLLTDPRTGKLTGCAFVRMSTAAEAKDAIINLDEALLNERLIRVKAVRPKKPVAPGDEVTATKPRHSRRPPRKQR